MHIGFLTPEFPHSFTSNSGGLGTSIKNLANELISQGIEVSIFIYQQQESHKFQEDGINFHLLEKKKYNLFGWFRYRKFIESYVNKQILLNKIDLIEAPDWTGITAFIRFKCPVLIRINGSDAYFCHLDKRKQKLKNFFLEKKALQSADMVVAVSHFAGEQTKRIFKLTKDIPVIPNGINVESFNPFSKPFVKNRLLYFGTIIRKKGILELAGIFNEVVTHQPEVELWVIGKDVVDLVEKRSTLELFNELLSPNAVKRVKYLREVDYHKVKELIATANIVLLPSFAEAFPMTWLEAMAMEKLLIASNIGWAPEILTQGETGIMIDPKNHRLFAEKILKALGDPELVREIGKKARKKIVQEFSTEIITEQNIDLYQKLVRKN